MVRPLVITRDMVADGFGPDRTWVSAENYLNLADAVACAGTAQITVFIDVPHAVTANLSVPENVELHFVRHGRVDIANGVTLTLASPDHIRAGRRQQVFACTGTGAVVFAEGGAALYPEWWGAQGDGVTDDTAAILAAQVASRPHGTPIHFGPRVYLSDPITVGSADWGGQWLGVGWCHNSGGPSNAKTILRLRAAAAQLVTFNGVHDWSARGIVFDGGGISTTAVFYFPGTSGTNKLQFEDCTVMRTTPATGDLIQIAGTIGVGPMTFHRCRLRQSDSVLDPKARYAFFINSNSNAFNITFEHCQIEQADVLMRCQGGAASLRDTNLYWWTTAAVQIINGAQPFEFDHIYTEQTDGVFFQQLTTAGTTYYRAMTFRNVIVAADATWAFTCQQRATLQDCYFGGNVTIDTPGAYATQYVLDNGGNQFAPGKAYSLTDTGGVGGGKLVGPTVSMMASHDYGAGVVAWTITASESTARLFTMTNASGAADAVFPVAVPGKVFTVYNNSGQAITVKVSGQVGSAVANGKRAIFVMDDVDCREVYEQP